jgi:hypothetical protein
MKNTPILRKRGNTGKQDVRKDKLAVFKQQAKLMGGLNLPFPDRMPARLRWAAIVSTAPGTPTATLNYRFSPYDPDQSGVGDQPVGFDQWMALYANFVVLHGRARVKTFDTGVVINALLPSRDISTVSTLSEALGQAHSSIDVTGASSNWPAKTEVALNIPEFFGMTPEQLRADDNFWGSASGDPVNLAFLRLFLTSTNVANISTSGYIVIDLDLEFFNRNQVNSS